MNNTNQLNDLVKLLTRDAETPTMIAKGIIECVHAANPEEAEKVAPYFGHLLEIVFEMGRIGAQS